MPERSAILAGLTEIANRAAGLAIAWHVVLALLGLAVILGLRPSRKLLALGISVALASVASCALWFGNPFNAGVLGTGAVVLAVLAVATPPERPAATPRLLRAVGAVLILFGWLYPHFLSGPAWRYLYAAPLGTVPCPTLSAAIGVALLGGGLAGRSYGWLLASLGVFYGAFGVLRLGVTIDLMLLVGAVALFASRLQAPGARRPGQLARA